MVISFVALRWGAFIIFGALFWNGIAYKTPPELVDNEPELFERQALSFQDSAPHQVRTHEQHSHSHVKIEFERPQCQQTQLQQRKSPVSPVPLRILNLGSSIVGGDVATDQNGYRYALRSALVADGHAVNMIGSVNIGSMGDNQVEGWGGYRIDQITLKADLSLTSLPNIVCILCGSNDVYQNHVDGMSDRMGAMVDKILNASPGVTVIVSTLPPNDNSGSPTWDATMQVFNANLSALVNARASAGEKVYLVDCHSSWWSVADMPRNNHPSDYGYKKMARVFYDGIRRARDAGVITPPRTPIGGINDSSPTDIINGTKCDKVAAYEIGPVTLGPGGRESNDGLYKPSQKLSTTVYTMATLGGGGPSTGLNWADVRLDDYINVHADMKQISVSLSLGAGKFAPVFNVDISNIGWPCTKENARFADIGGDGLADFCCISDAGAITCGTNNYIKDSAWKFSNLVAFAPAIPGYTGVRNRIADIDGDGRADRLVISANGDITAWRNSGTGATVGILQPLGVVSSGKAFSDADGIRLIDINGDGRADLLWLNDFGRVTTWINNRGFVAGNLAPTWSIPIVTHPGTTVAGTRALTTFGKIFGDTRSDPIWGYIKSDMVLAKDVTTGKTITTTFQIYENTGANGLRLNGDGVQFCDMRGTGSDDYLWVTRDGIVQLYGNQDTPPNWIPYGNIFNAQRNRQELHFADVDGDGKCDILLVNKTTGAVTMHRNEYNATSNTFIFTNIGIVSGNVTCTESYGTALYDLGVRFADMNGDGKADYLCIKRDGSTTAYINNGPGDFTSIGPIYSPAGVERVDVRYADVNGDGLADYLVVDKFTGAYNASINSNGNGIVKFTPQGMVSNGGRARGECAYFANLNGTNRADYIVADPATANQSVFYNTCPDRYGILGPPPLPLPTDPSNPNNTGLISKPMPTTTNFMTTASATPTPLPIPTNLAFSPDTGAVTTIVKPIITGKVPAYITVHVYLDGVFSGVATSGDDGIFTYEFTTPLSLGKHTITATTVKTTDSSIESNISNPFLVQYLPITVSSVVSTTSTTLASASP